MSSPGVAEPMKAKGQVFQLINDLDERVETIEVGLVRVQHYTEGKHAFQPGTDSCYVNDTSNGAYVQLNTRLFPPFTYQTGL